MRQAADNPLVYIDASEIHGSGLFAACELSEGQLIGFYQGPVVDDDGIYVLWVEDDEGGWVGYEGDNSMRFLNHSDLPNAEMYGLECYALKNISAGQEITIDYGWGEA